MAKGEDNHPVDDMPEAMESAFRWAGIILLLVFLMGFFIGFNLGRWLG